MHCRVDHADLAPFLSVQSNHVFPGVLDIVHYSISVLVYVNQLWRPRHRYLLIEHGLYHAKQLFIEPNLPNSVRASCVVLRTEIQRVFVLVTNQLVIDVVVHNRVFWLEVSM